MTSKTLATKIADASVAVGALATDKRNAQQGYDYISADKILERCGDALAHAGVILIPAITAADVLAVETRTSRGEGIRYDADVSFAMTLSDGETTLEFPWRGRGSDYAVPDKALYKAITSGHKYFLMKLLNVGVGNEDGEHEAVEAPQRPAQATQPPAARNTARAAAAPRSAPPQPPRNGVERDVDLGMGGGNPFDDAEPPTDEEHAIIAGWEGQKIGVWHAWAIDQGANEFESKKRLSKIVDAHGGWANGQNAAAIALAFIRRTREQHATAQAA